MNKKICIILIFVLLVSFVGCSTTNQSDSNNQPPIIETTPTLTPEEQATKYNDEMSAVLENEYRETVTGNLAVSLEIKEDTSLFIEGETVEYRPTTSKTYTTKYVPDNLIATSPDEVRYIIRCTHSEEYVGTYKLDTLKLDAYQRTIFVEIVDSVSQKVLETKLFYGDMPSETITNINNTTGPYPNEDIIKEWVYSVINK